MDKAVSEQLHIDVRTSVPQHVRFKYVAATTNAMPNAHQRSPHRCRRSHYRAAAVETGGMSSDAPKALDTLRARLGE